MLKRFSIYTLSIAGIISLYLLPGTEKVFGGSMQHIRLFESAADTAYHTQAIVTDDQLYLSSEFLTSTLGLERKPLPNGTLGLCLGDLCIPMTSRDGDNPVLHEQNQQFFSINYFLDALKSRYVWDRESGVFLLDLQTHSQEQPEQGEHPVDFSLPTLAGKKVKLSDYRGRKVAVFAWASW